MSLNEESEHKAGEEVGSEGRSERRGGREFAQSTLYAILEEQIKYQNQK